MVWLPGARVDLGTPEEVLDLLVSQQHYPRSWFEDEAPTVQVDVKAFWIDRYPVTNQQFAAFVSSTNYRTVAERRGFGLVYTASNWAEVPGCCWRAPTGPGSSVAARLDHPVVHVALEDAERYASWVGKRLTTEIEWEYAATGGRFRVWPWGDRWDRLRCGTAEYWAGRSIDDTDEWRTWWNWHYASGDRTPGTTPVGYFGRRGTSPFGVADLAGNVQEWTSSPYWFYSSPDSSYDEMYRFLVGKYVVVRGGGWMNMRFQTRCGERMPTDPHGYSSWALGFRCAYPL